jgi:hypothetical protein
MNMTGDELTGDELISVRSCRIPSRFEAKSQFKRGEMMLLHFEMAWNVLLSTLNARVIQGASGGIYLTKTFSRILELWYESCDDTSYKHRACDLPLSICLRQFTKMLSREHFLLAARDNIHQAGNQYWKRRLHPLFKSAANTSSSSSGAVTDVLQFCISNTAFLCTRRRDVRSAESRCWQRRNRQIYCHDSFWPH